LSDPDDLQIHSDDLLLQPDGVPDDSSSGEAVSHGLPPPLPKAYRLSEPPPIPHQMPPAFPAVPAATGAAAEPPVAVRDRVVILGRTQAGKTVFVSRLYEQLWNSKEAMIHMRALSGVPHVNLMTMIESMRKGRWPDATIGQQFVDVETTFARRKFRMTLLDYPGEVFSKAFVRGELEAADTVDLVEHIDRAAGAILLVDPQNAVDSRDASKQADDDFGMQQVVHRIRGFPGGEQVPIAVVLTKCDLRNDLIRSLGGLETFAKTYLLNLLRPAGRCLKLFKSVAVWTRKSRRTGEWVPDMERSPLNLVEPLMWVLQQIIRMEQERDHGEKVSTATKNAKDLAMEALGILNDTGRPVRDRIGLGEATLRAAVTAGGEALPEVIKASSLVIHLKEESERKSERNVLLGIAISVITVVAALGWGLWRLGLFGVPHAG
jgi:GTPase SAR1 family protein